MYLLYEKEAQDSNRGKYWLENRGWVWSSEKEF